MKNLLKLYLLSIIFISSSVFAMDGVAVIDMRTAVLSTQAAADAFKALEEDPDYSSNLEEAKSLQADRKTPKRTRNSFSRANCRNAKRYSR
jgi:outer membrane protein